MADGVFEQFLSLGNEAFDLSVDEKKFGFFQEGPWYILEIRNLEFADAANYKCGNIVSIDLTGELRRKLQM